MTLADEKTPLKTKMAIVVNAITCDPCQCENVADCDLKKELDEMNYIPISKGSEACKYCISQKNGR